MDAQHQEWFGNPEQAAGGDAGRQPKEVQQSILGEMAAYTRNHFEQEEARLKAKG